jgi:hypothetical protein
MSAFDFLPFLHVHVVHLGVSTLWYSFRIEVWLASDDHLLLNSIFFEVIWVRQEILSRPKDGE